MYQEIGYPKGEEQKGVGGSGDRKGRDLMSLVGPLRQAVALQEESVTWLT